MAKRFFETADHALLYSKFRPAPPDTIVKRIISYLKEKYCGPLIQAADVGCGTGQSTTVLSPYFKSVVGLDISNSQINEALKRNKQDNVSYKISAAESLPFADQTLQLITTSQAFHWFDKKLFFQESKRVLCPKGIIAVYGYDFPRPVYKDKSEELHQVLVDTYLTNRPYWSKDRDLVDEHYKNISIPFLETDRDDSLYSKAEMTLAEMAGYMSTWSGIQNYRKKHGDEAANKIIQDYQERFLKVMGVGGPPESVSFTTHQPFFLLLGRTS